MICPQCRMKDHNASNHLDQMGGPVPESVMMTGMPHDPIGYMCKTCGHEFKLYFYPKPLVLQRQFGTA